MGDLVMGHIFISSPVSGLIFSCPMFISCKVLMSFIVVLGQLIFYGNVVIVCHFILTVLFFVRLNYVIITHSSNVYFIITAISEILTSNVKYNSHLFNAFSCMLELSNTQYMSHFRVSCLVCTNEPPKGFHNCCHFPVFLNLLFLNCMALDMVIINGIPFIYQMQLSHFYVLQRGLLVGYCMCSV